MKVVALVSTYKRPKILAGCLSRLRGQSHALHRIIVVDTGQDPETQRVIEANGPLLYLKHENDPYAAINAGIARAIEVGFDWLWVMDSDAWPRPNTLETMLLWASRLPEAKALVPVKQAGSRLITGVQWVKGRVPMRDIPLPEKPVRVDAAGWMANLLSWQWVREVGLTKQEFFFGMGDLEYLIRGTRSGLKAYLIPDAVVDVAWLRDTVRGPVAGFPVRSRHYWYLKARNYTYFLITMKRPLALAYYTAGLAKDWVKALGLTLTRGESYPVSSVLWQLFGYGVGLTWSLSHELPGKRKGFRLGS